MGFEAKNYRPMNEISGRIEDKLNSISFQPGFTLSSDEALFYVVITELRLALQSNQLIIIEKIDNSGEVIEYHTNGSKSEYVIAKYIYKRDNMAKDFFNYFKDKFRKARKCINQNIFKSIGIKDKEPQKIGSEKIVEERKNKREYLSEVIRKFLLNFKRYVLEKSTESEILEKIQKLSPFDTFFEKCFGKEIIKMAFGTNNLNKALGKFWHYNPEWRQYYLMNFLQNLVSLIDELSGVYDNQFFDKMNSVLEQCLTENEKWKIIIFYNSADTKEELIKEALKNLNFTRIIEKYEKGKTKIGIKKDDLKKQLVPIVKYRNYILSTITFSEPIIENKNILNAIKRKDTEGFLNLVKEFSLYMYEILTLKRTNIEQILDEKDTPKTKLKKINSILFQHRLYYNLRTKDGDVNVLAHLFESSIFSKVFDATISKIYGRAEKILEEIEFDFTFYLFDEENNFTWYIPSNKIRKLKITLRDPSEQESFKLSRKFLWHKVEKEEGFSEYVTQTNYPQLGLKFLLKQDFEHRLIRITKHKWRNTLRFFRLIKDKNTMIPIDFIQIPIVFSLIEFRNGLEYLTQKYGMYGIYPVYNFNFNFKSHDNIFSFFRQVFDLSFESLFIMSYLQKNQEDFIKASLFEEATESFKKAMKFPLIEESEPKEK